MLRTTYNAQGDGIREFDYFEKRANPDGSVDILGWGRFGSSSVLAGQAMKSFLDCFSSEAEADAALHEAGIQSENVNWNSPWLEPQISVNHLPDDSDY